MALARRTGRWFASSPGASGTGAFVSVAGCEAGEFARSRRASTARGRGPVVPRGRLTDCASSAGSARVPVPEGLPVCPPSPRPRVVGDRSGAADTQAEPQGSERDEGRGVGDPVAVRPPRCSLRAPRTTDRARRPPTLPRCPVSAGTRVIAHGFLRGFRSKTRRPSTAPTGTGSPGDRTRCRRPPLPVRGESGPPAPWSRCPRESGGDLVSVGGLDGTPPAPERGRVGIRQGSADLLARLTRAVAMKNQRVEFWRRCCHNASQNGDRA